MPKSKTVPNRVDASIVSCDIVGHGTVSEHRQCTNIETINAFVREAIDQYGRKQVVWASGGDGGHTAFIADAPVDATLKFARGLVEWSLREEVPLRIAVHRGKVTLLEGADGRVQLAGTTMNLCGSVVNFGRPGAVIATKDFWRFVQAQRGTRDGLAHKVRFGDERTVYLKHRKPHSLLSLRFPELVLPRRKASRPDHLKLKEAAAKGLDWQIIYYSKRILLTNSNDAEALSALMTIKPMRLRTTDDELSPFVWMTVASIVDVVREAHLIERSDGDIVCEKGDSGDQMFIVLSGHIGVLTEDRSWSPYDTTFTAMGEGHIVGELALALQRTRTASLQAIGPTALLAIDYPAYKRLIRKKRGIFLRKAFDRLIIRRALEHICRNTDFLAEPKSCSKPSTRSKHHTRKSAALWTKLEDGTSLITYDREAAYSISYKDPKLAEAGLYILASGQLVEKSESEGARKVLCGERFDILYVNLPHEIVSSGHEYHIDPKSPPQRVSVFQITKEALQNYAGAAYFELLESIARRLAKQMMFDVFISYSMREDGARALRWRDRLRKAGLSVYMSQLEQPMTEFEVEINVALAESLVFMPFISRASSRSAWVHEEMKRRRSIFPDRPNILVVSLEDNIAAEMFGGIGWLKAGQSAQENDSIRSAIETIKSVRAGNRKPPLRKHAR